MLAKNLQKIPSWKITDPTETMPEPPPPKCKVAHNTDENQCKHCKNLNSWWSRFKNTVDDLLL